LNVRATIIHIQCLIYTSSLSLKAPLLVNKCSAAMRAPNRNRAHYCTDWLYGFSCETVMEMSKPKLHLWTMRVFSLLCGITTSIDTQVG